MCFAVFEVFGYVFDFCGIVCEEGGVELAPARPLKLANPSPLRVSSQGSTVFFTAVWTPLTIRIPIVPGCTRNATQRNATARWPEKHSARSPGLWWCSAALSLILVSGVIPHMQPLVPTVQVPTIMRPVDCTVQDMQPAPATPHPCSRFRRAARRIPTSTSGAEHTTEHEHPGSKRKAGGDPGGTTPLEAELGRLDTELASLLHQVLRVGARRDDVIALLAAESTPAATPPRSLDPTGVR